MYEIELLDGKKIWMNERIIMKVIPNNDNTLTLHHFNVLQLCPVGQFETRIYQLNTK